MKLKNICICLALLSTMTACNDLLNEEPKDFLTPENSYINKAGYEAALASIYSSIRTNFYAATGLNEDFDMLAIDNDYNVLCSGKDVYTEYFYWNTLNPDNGIVKKWWQRLYTSIFNCNVIINRAEGTNVKWNSEREKNAIIGEAKFLRAFFYRFLANMWGNAPLVLEETTAPKFDYKSVSQQELYEQCKSDLKFAIEWMPEIDDQKGGRASKAAAQHLLTEILIGLGEYEEAVQSASDVIDNPSMSLMKERFGTLKDFKFQGWDYQGEEEPWGDVYWDLFQEGNFNRIDGNKECIWNVQFDYQIEGGGNTGQWGGNFCLERYFGTEWWNLKDADGISNYLKPRCSGRPISQLEVTDYLSDKIWEFKDDWNRDMRNSQFNARRDYYWTNPNGRFYGKKITIETLGDPNDIWKVCKPTFTKAATAIHHDQFQDAISGEWHDNGRIYKDWYIMRLAETYLLRAEAYYRNGDLQNAANDINAIRERAHATPVSAEEVTLDLILDERARELYLEEYRLNTLMRMDKLSEYLSKYNTKVIQAGYTLDSHINKFPIPNSEIEANKEGGLVQNPGY